MSTFLNAHSAYRALYVILTRATLEIPPLIEAILKIQTSRNKFGLGNHWKSMSRLHGHSNTVHTT